MRVTNISFDPATRVASVNVTTTFVSAVNGDFRVNLYVVEDSVSGTGLRYDQNNFLSHDPRYIGHPYYNLPDPIKGYQHRHVVRALAGGVWGVQGVIPDSVIAGQEFSRTFTFPISGAWKADNISVVGFVQKYDTAVAGREILNVASAKLTNLPPKITGLNLTLGGSAISVKASGATTFPARVRNSSVVFFREQV